MTQCDDHLLSIPDAVQRLRRERPHARAFLDPFVGLLLAREPLLEELERDQAADATVASTPYTSVATLLPSTSGARRTCRNSPGR